MPKDYLPECPCGSHQEAEAVYDARRIFLAYCCNKCKEKTLSKYRPEVLEDPSYEADEPIEPEDYY